MTTAFLLNDDVPAAAKKTVLQALAKELESPCIDASTFTSLVDALTACAGSHPQLRAECFHVMMLATKASSLTSTTAQAGWESVCTSCATLLDGEGGN